MNIAIIGDRGIPARYSGFSTLVEELSVRLAGEHGMDVTVYCRSPYYDSFPETYRGVRCVYLPAPRFKSFESIIHSNLSIFHAVTKPYDLVFVVDPGNAPFAWPLALRGVPTVFHTDGLGWMRRKWNRLERAYYKWSERVCAGLATWLVTDSRAMKEYYVSEYGAPSSFIPYAGEVGGPPDNSCLEKYGLEAGGYCLVVARVEPENNIDHIVREFKAAGTGRRLVVVGGAHYRSEYSDRLFAEADDRVSFLGGVYEPGLLNGLYNNCYLYLHGHEVGGTNPSLLRAMESGAACVPIDVVFHREVVGGDGLYFGKTPGGLAEVITELDSDPARVAALGRSCRDRAVSLYRWDAVASGYAELFRKVVEAKRRGVPPGGLITGEVYRPEEFA